MINLHPLLIKTELSKYKDYGLDKYDDILLRLYGHYQSRYYENKDKSTSKGTDELKEFDALWFDLFQKIQMPIEIKYRNAFTSRMFEEDDYGFHDNYRYWCLHLNKAFEPHVLEMKKMYDAVTAYLYPPK